MTRILLIRHGSTDLLGRVLYGRMPGVHLNAQGCRQARETGEALKARYKIDAVVSSPLERATETAQFIAGPQNVSVSTEEGLNELDCGTWVGQAFSDLKDSEEWRQYNRHRSTKRPPGGESLMEAQARGWRSLENICTGHQNATIAVITHGDIIRGLLLLLLGMPLDHILRLEIEPASVSEIAVDGGNVLVRSINETVFRWRSETMKEQPE
jgi:broad specificity phosphatase PhoE